MVYHTIWLVTYYLDFYDDLQRQLLGLPLLKTDLVDYQMDLAQSLCRLMSMGKSRSLSVAIFKDK